MSEVSSASLGPSVFATLVTRDLDRAVAAYKQFLALNQSACGMEFVSPALADLWGCPGLAGARQCLLENALGEPFVRIVEDPAVSTTTPLHYHGWMALEVVVEDVDGLAQTIQEQGSASGFEVLRPAADLELSDKIRASQVAGPCGEVLYLTRISGEVPPFDLPRARCPVDRLFIPVVSVPDRAASMTFYEGFPGTQCLQFQTRITVVNQAFGLPLEQQHPVATVSLRGQSLIEIDELAPARPHIVSEGTLPAGIASISFEVDSFDQLASAGVTLIQSPRRITEAPYAGRRVAMLQGTAGELIELIERTV
ncbi:hypothetical protein [uncultured Microbulbifer sp.]|uniref:VOC family protein n=1 Tax=uncultured Microbulbifer sp. TaxID=348147 RepID=UPI00261F949F|nr:hypothetical protein [uncultured Microbulbifer sp.]